MYIHNIYYPYLENYSLYYIILIAYFKKRSAHIDAGTTNTYISTQHLYKWQDVLSKFILFFIIHLRMFNKNFFGNLQCWVILNWKAAVN